MIYILTSWIYYWSKYKTHEENDYFIFTKIKQKKSKYKIQLKFVIPGWFYEIKFEFKLIIKHTLV